MADAKQIYTIVTTESVARTFDRYVDIDELPALGEWVTIDKRVGNLQVRHVDGDLDECPLIEFETCGFRPGPGLDSLIQHLTNTGWTEETYHS